MSQVTMQEIRQRRTKRRVEAFTGELGRLNWERRMLHEEYIRVASIYARHLERIKVKALKNTKAMAALSDKVIDVFGAPAEPHSSPAVTQET